jgi:hypothetical protein
MTSWEQSTVAFSCSNVLLSFTLAEIAFKLSSVPCVRQMKSKDDAFSENPIYETVTRHHLMLIHVTINFKNQKCQNCGRRLTMTDLDDDKPTGHGRIIIVPNSKNNSVSIVPQHAAVGTSSFQ